MVMSLTQPLTILGIDPGTVKMGWGVLRRRPSRLEHIDNGVVQAKPRDPLDKRLGAMHLGLVEVLTHFKPDVVVVEEVFVFKNPKSALHLGHARGVVLAGAATAGIDVVSYSTTRVKKTVTGTGRATKLQVQMMVKTLLMLPEIPLEDAADALALSICHCHHETETTIRDRIATRARR
ncbi:MAG: crossover junction endodeoxyribonuclease RuvC [Myxococcota bacterium]|jgi:crossover junction endodeoxyribonuclease RuvC